MRALSLALRTRLAEQATELAYCLRIERTDGVVHAFTSWDSALAISGETFQPAESLRGAALRTGLGFEADSLAAGLLLDHEELTEEDLRAGRFDSAQAAILVCDPGDPDGTVHALAEGWRMGEVVHGTGEFTAELVSLAGYLDRAVLRTYGRRCPLVFGETRCGVDTAALDLTGSVTGSNATLFAFEDTTRPEEDGFFDHGQVVFVDGPNAPEQGGWAVEIMRFAGGVFELRGQLRAAPIAGDAYTVRPGCDKHLATCRDRYQNIQRFRGYGVFCPGRDALIKHPVT
jgi:uncharacterized phage protein (TIGR02218 family)